MFPFEYDDNVWLKYFFFKLTNVIKPHYPPIFVFFFFLVRPLLPVVDRLPTITIIIDIIYLKCVAQLNRRKIIRSYTNLTLNLYSNNVDHNVYCKLNSFKSCACACYYSRCSDNITFILYSISFCL